MNSSEGVQHPPKQPPCSSNLKEGTMSNSSSSSGGVSFIGLLTILFIALKLTGVIAWGWFWVLSPIWITILIAIGLFALAIWLGSL